MKENVLLGETDI